MTPTFATRAVGDRCGIFRPPVLLPATAADPGGVFHASVSREGHDFVSAGGGVARTIDQAKTAAVAESLERYAAAEVVMPLARSDEIPDGERCVGFDEFTLHSEAQRSSAEFPHTDAYADPWFGRCFDLTGNDPVWVPVALIGLDPRHGAFTTSSGLAAHTDPWLALMRAIQELIERDAYVTTWLHQLGGRLVETRSAGSRVGGRLRIFDLTPTYSPHPVAAVTGSVELLGEPRHSIGLACREDWTMAVERAELECLQGITFIGNQLARNPGLRALRPEDVTDFDRHALYYSANPERWEELPIHSHSVSAEPPEGRGEVASATELPHLVAHLRGQGIALFYRDLTPIDVAQLGLTTVRVLSPELTPIHHDHRWPFLGGRSADLSWRYRDGLERRGDRTFPSPAPHALG